MRVAAGVVVLLGGLLGLARPAAAADARDLAIAALGLDLGAGGGPEASALADDLYAQACQAGWVPACEPSRWRVDEEGDLGRASTVLAPLCAEGDPAACSVVAWALLDAQEPAAALAPLVPPLVAGCDEGVLGACMQAVLLIGPTATPAEARRQVPALLTTACEGGHAAACTILGTALRDGQFGSMDPEQAVAATRRGCELGDPMGCFTAASILEQMGPYPAGAHPSVALYLETARLLDPVGQRPSLDVAVALQRAGQVQREAGELESAQEQYERALEALEAVGLGRSSHAGWVLAGLGLVRRAQGEYRLALDDTGRALAIMEDAEGASAGDRAVLRGNLGEVQRSLGDLDGARESLEHAVAVLIRDEPSSRQTLAARQNLALVLFDSEQFSDAHEHLVRLVEDKRTHLGPGHPSTALSMSTLATVLTRRGELDQALELAESAHRTLRQHLGSEHADTLAVLNNLANIQIERGDFAAAESNLRTALATKVRVLGADHPSTSLGRLNLAGFASNHGNPREAQALLEQALADLERRLGPDSVKVGLVSAELGDVYAEFGDFARASRHLERALQIHQALDVGGQHAAVGVLGRLARMEVLRGDYEAATQWSQQQVKLSRRLHGEGGYKHATALLTRSMVAVATGDLATGLASAEAALALVQGEPVADLDRLSVAHMCLATAHHAGGNLDDADQHARSGLALSEQWYGPEHTELAAAHHMLGRIATERTELDRALDHLRRAEAIQRAAYGDEHPLVALTTNVLMLHHYTRGDLEQAETFARETLRVRRSVLGEAHVATVEARLNLAGVLRAAGRTEQALPLYRGAVDGLESALGADHWRTGQARSNLAVGLMTLGRLAEAQAQLSEASPVMATALGPTHPDVILVASNQAFLLERQGQGAEAARLLEDMVKALLPEVTTTDRRATQLLRELARVAAAADRPETARWALEQLLPREAEQVALGLAFGTPSQKRTFLDSVGTPVDEVVSLHLLHLPDDPRGAELALDALLIHKGRVIEAEADALRRLRASLTPAHQQLLAELEQARAARDVVVRRVSAAKDRHAIATVLTRLDADVADLEAALVDASAALREQVQPTRRIDVSAHLADGTALVELVRWQSDLPDASGAGAAGHRYAAYVLHADGRVGWADLGDAEAIESAVADLRAVLQARQHWRPARDVLRGLILTPLRDALGDADHLVVAPDGALNLVPLGLLLADSDSLGAPGPSIRIVSSGRDLAQAAEPAPSEPSLVVANVDYGLGPAASAPTRWVPLPGTVEEGQAVAASLPQAHLLEGAAATEAAVRATSNPHVLHIATHGYFEGPDATPDQLRAETRSQRLRPTLSLLHVGSASRAEARSGLVLAGANGEAGDDLDNGYLSAAEAASMTLDGTRLVVLSACSTGVGPVRDGEGVQGLRRALALAGARAQIVSLWDVDDAATAALMGSLYEHLAEGHSVEQALAAAVGAVRAVPQWDHPFFWAAFVLSGDGSVVVSLE